MLGLILVSRRGERGGEIAAASEVDFKKGMLLAARLLSTAASQTEVPAAVPQFPAAASGDPAVEQILQDLDEPVGKERILVVVAVRVAEVRRG